MHPKRTTPGVERLDKMMKLKPAALKAKLEANPEVNARFVRVTNAKKEQEHGEKTGARANGGAKENENANMTQVCGERVPFP